MRTEVDRLTMLAVQAQRVGNERMADEYLRMAEAARRILGRLGR